jgi:alkylhydroperoxidase/carboxymuconolactone decarboxylase family protein YurZ
LSVSEGLSDEAARLRSGYEAMFGAVPDMVAARIRFVGEVAPRFQTLTEALRSDALVNGVLDARTVQLFLFGLLLTTRPDAAAGHAVAARRLGAGFDELLAVAELVAMAGAVGALNVGGALLARLHDEEPR